MPRRRRHRWDPRREWDLHKAATVSFLFPFQLRRALPWLLRGNTCLKLAPACLAVTLGSLAEMGCASIPMGAVSVNSLSVEGNKKISSSDIVEKLATAESPKFLGLFRGIVYDYELLDASVLQRDLERVERHYRARGYYEAQARAGRIRPTGGRHVEVTIEVAEGEPVIVREARIAGIEGLSAKDDKAVRAALSQLVKAGVPFEEEPYQKAETTMTRVLTDRGYAWARIERSADVDLPGHHATLLYTARLGPKATFGRIEIKGLGELPPAPVVRAIDLSPGEAYSTASLDAAQQAALDLGTFSSVEITPDLSEPPPPSAVVNLRVQVQVQKLKSVLLGGGLELDSIRAQAHLHAGWEHRNLFGGFRHFIVDFKPGLDLYPTRLPTFQQPTTGLFEERFRAELRQPGFIEARTNGVVSSQVNAYPLLLTTRVDPAAPVLGYLEYKGSIGLDRTLWKLFASSTYNFQWNNPFAYQGKRDPDLLPLVISYADVVSHFDYRDDRLRPHRGL